MAGVSGARDRKGAAKGAAALPSLVGWVAPEKENRVPPASGTSVDPANIQNRGMRHRVVSDDRHVSLAPLHAAGSR